MKGTVQEAHSQENKNVFGTSACYREQDLSTVKGVNNRWKRHKYMYF